MSQHKQIRCVVGPETVRMLNLGHPWVIADRHTSRWPQFKNGSLIELVSEQGVSLGTGVYDADSRIVARRLSSQKIEFDPWLISRLEQAKVSRNRLDFGDTTVGRLVNAEGDGIPGLTVDRYNDYLMVNDYQLEDYGITFGLGLPVKSIRSSLNLSFTYGTRGTTDYNLVKENYGIVTFNVTLHDLWFRKRRFD